MKGGKNGVIGAYHLLFFALTLRAKCRLQLIRTGIDFVFTHPSNEPFSRARMNRKANLAIYLRISNRSRGNRLGKKIGQKAISQLLDN